MTVMIEGTEYLPVSTVAKQLGTTELKVLMLLRQQALTGEQVGGIWQVTAQSLAAYRPPAPGEPAAEPRCRTGCGATACGCH